MLEENFPVLPSRNHSDAAVAQNKSSKLTIDEPSSTLTIKRRKEDKTTKKSYSDILDRQPTSQQQSKQHQPDLPSRQNKIAVITSKLLSSAHTPSQPFIQTSLGNTKQKRRHKLCRDAKRKNRQGRNKRFKH